MKATIIHVGLDVDETQFHGSALHRDRTAPGSSETARNRLGVLDPGAIDTWLSGLGAWAPVAYVVLYAAATVVFLPGSVFALAGGALFGPVWGAVLNLTAATLGAGAAFLVARYVAGDWVARRTGAVPATLDATPD